MGHLDTGVPRRRGRLAAEDVTLQGCLAALERCVGG